MKIIHINEGHPHAHCMSSSNMKFIFEEHEKFAKNPRNYDMIMFELEEIFLRYGIKSVDLEFDIFNLNGFENQ